MNSKYLLLLFVLTLTIRVNANTWTITDAGLSFDPDIVTITVGDTVIFSLDNMHNAVEVSQTTWNANGSNPLIGGFQTNFGGGTVTGLAIGTHYYVCDPHAGAGMKGRIVVQAAQQPVFIPNVWINEIHYDDIGTDSLEGYEIVGPAGTDLACFRVLLYNGANGAVYRTDTLSGIIPDSACGFGAKWFPLPTDGMQNGSPDGIVLEYAPTALTCAVNHQDTILQFLSYEGTMTALSGRAIGLTSTDIQVTEGGSTPEGFSLQLGGAGNNYDDFVWQSATLNTHNRINNNQYFCGAPTASYRFTPVSSTYSESAGTVIAGYVEASNVFVQPQTIQVVLTGGNGSAADINNYTTQTLTFNPAVSDSLPLSITITDDVVVEGAETLIFTLRNASHSGSIAADSIFTLTITDNDTATPPTVQFIIASSTVDENVGSFLIGVSISPSSPNPTSVDVNVLGGGSATSGADFTYSPITLTFPPNSVTNQFITVNIVDDAAVEGSESFTFRLANPTNNAVVGSNELHVVTITDNDAIQIGFAATSLTVSEGAGIVSIPVSMNATSANNTSVTVQLQPIGTTATPASDFIFSDTTITWLAGNSGNISVPLEVIDDATTEPIEYVRLILSNATNGAQLSVDTFLLSITDNEVPPPGTIRFVSVATTELESAGTVAVVVEIANPFSSTLSFAVARDDVASTASAGLDYTYTNQVRNISTTGTTLDTVYIDILDDLLIEPTETVVLRFINVSSNLEVLSDSVFTLSIMDDDVLTVSFMGAGFSYSEQDTMVQVRVTLSSPVPDSTTSITVSLAAGSATNGVDFVFTDTILVFPPNTNDTLAVWVTLLDDNLVEGNEQINFNLSNATNGATLGISAYTLTIIDNDSIVGIPDAGTNNSVIVYPNPAISMITVESESSLDNVKITNMIGNVVMNLERFAPGKNQINLSELLPGMYFLNIHDSRGTIIKRFVKSE